MVLLVLGRPPPQAFGPEPGSPEQEAAGVGQNDSGADMTQLIAVASNQSMQRTRRLSDHAEAVRSLSLPAWPCPLLVLWLSHHFIPCPLLRSNYSRSLVPFLSSAVAHRLIRCDVPRFIPLTRFGLWVLPQVVPAAPLYTRAQQHQAGSKARATSIRDKALAHAVIADRAGFLAVRGPTHLRDWGTKLASRTGQLEAAIVRSQPIHPSRL